MVKWIDGKPVVYHGKYREDTCLIPDAVKNLFRTRPKGKRFSPDVGLAHYMEQERMRDMTTRAPSNGNKIYRGTIAECASKSAQMKKVMQDVGAQVGTEEDKILELKGDKPFMHNRWQADVETQKLTDSDGSTLD